jgi:hypothetical protein
MTIHIDQNTFASTTTVTVTTATLPSGAVNSDQVRTSNICIDINAGGNQPQRELTFTLNYTTGDIAGLNEGLLVLGRFDTIHHRWIIILPTLRDPINHRLIFPINHFSTFALLQLVPAANLESVTAYPNPFNPASNSLSIVNLVANARVKIYTVTGQLIRELSDDDGDGRVIWDGRNDGNTEVASGVYIGYISGSGATKKVKIAVER